jgi:hypothetical protein
MKFQLNKTALVLLLLLMAGLGSTLSAQPGRRGERIESLKIAHLSGRLNLDPQTAEKFWPLYHQYEREMQELVLEKRRLNRMDDRSADDILEQEQKALDIRKKYHAQFLRVIDNNQLGQLMQAEKEFRQMVIRRARRMDMDQDRPGGGFNREQRFRDNGGMPPVHPGPGRMQVPQDRRNAQPMQDAPARRPMRGGANPRNDR